MTYMVIVEGARRTHLPYFYYFRGFARRVGTAFAGSSGHG